MAVVAARRLGEMHRHLDMSELAFGRVVDHGEHADLGQMGTGEQILRRIHRHDRHIGLLQQLKPFGGSPLRHDLQHDGVERVDIL